MVNGLKIALIFTIVFLCASGWVCAQRPDGFVIMADYAGNSYEAAQAEPAKWEFDDVDQARGFKLLVVDTEIDVKPNWVADKQQIMGSINTFACKKQYRAASMVLATNRPVSGLKYNFNDLKCGRSIISNVNCDLRIIGYQTSKDKLQWGGNWLEKFDNVSLPAQYTAWLWVTFYVPDETKAGVYTGQLNITSVDSNSVSVPIRLNVLDFELQWPDYHYGAFLVGHFYRPDIGIYQRWASDSAWNSKNLELYFKYWKTRGLNSPAIFWVYPELKCVDGNAVAEFNDVRQFAQAMKKADIDGDLVVDLRWVEWWAQAASVKLAQLRAEGKEIKGDLGIYGYNGTENPLIYSDEAKRLFRESVEQLLATAEKEKWGRIRLLPEEELCCGQTVAGKVAGYEAFMPILQEIAPAEAYFVDNSVGYERYTNEASDRATRDKLLFREFNNWNEAGLENARKQGSEIRSYNMGWQRSSFGLYNERIGSTGHHMWADQVGTRSVGEPNCQFTLIKPDGIVSSIPMERVREGIDDRAYYYTLRGYIAELEKKNKLQAAKACEQVLYSIAMDVPLDRYEYNDFRVKVLTGKELDSRRLKVATTIEKAINLLNGRAKDSDLVVDSNMPSLSDPNNAGTLFNVERLEVAYQSAPVLMDGKLDETCWQQKANVTCPLWWIGNDEAVMRARAGDQESFKVLYTPVQVVAKVACDVNGLYFAIDSAKALPDDNAVISLKLSNGSCVKFIVGQQKTIEMLSSDGSVKSEGFKIGMLKQDDGRLMQELFVPWSLLNINQQPGPGMSLGLQISYVSGKNVITWVKVKNSPDEKWGKIVF